MARKKIALDRRRQHRRRAGPPRRRSRSSATSSCSTSSRGCRQGKALDLEQNSAVAGYDAAHHRHERLRARSTGADVVIVTAGVPRKPGMSRDDLIGINAEDHRSVGENDQEALPRRLRDRHLQPARRDGLGDAEASPACRRKRVVGMAGVLDSRALPAISWREELGVSVKDVRALVLGGHGDTMVPLVRYCTVNGIPCPTSSRWAGRRRSKLDAIVAAHAQRRRRDRQAAEDRLGLLRAGALGDRDGRGLPASDQKRVLPCAALPRRRVRRQGPLRRRAGRHRRRRRREDRRDRARRPTRRRCSTSRRPRCASSIEAVKSEAASRADAR